MVANAISQFLRSSVVVLPTSSVVFFSLSLLPIASLATGYKIVIATSADGMA